MKIPKTIFFGLDAWQVKQKMTSHIKDRSCRGLTVFEDRKIYIDPAMHQDQKEETFIHELLHVCGHYASITGEKMGDESFVTKIAPILKLILKQNDL